MKKFAIILLLASFNVLAKQLPPDAFVMSQTPCYGTCPVFEVAVFSDGTTIFTGENNVESIGVYKLPSDPELFQKIVNLTDQFEFNSFRDEYGWSGDEKVCKEQWTDNPSTILSLQFAGQVKSIHHYHGCRGFEREQELKQLEKELYELLGLKAYVGT